MELSPVPSSRVTGSDFSIERILSEEPTTQSSEPPSWLCCTRYRPPKVHRASSACRSRRSGRHARVPFSGAQAAALEAAYARAPYLAPHALRALADALQLRDDRIKIWFQNRRARERREKNSVIESPHTIALPATSHTPRSRTDIARWTHSQERPTLSYQPQFSSTPIATRNSHNIAINNVETDSSGSDDRCDTPLDIETVD